MEHKNGLPSHVTDPIPTLDRIRAIAVTLVFFAQRKLEPVIPGGLGAIMPLVLGGYLFTTLMRIEHALTGTIHYRAFYLRLWVEKPCTDLRRRLHKRIVGRESARDTLPVGTP